jgi:hypothetical protein
VGVSDETTGLKCPPETSPKIRMIAKASRGGRGVLEQREPIVVW